MRRAWIPPVAALVCLELVGGAACSGAPARHAAERSAPPPRPVADDCALEPGKTAPEPLLRAYDGLASKARCQREVYTIMAEVTHFLGVRCEYCHVKDDYPADTHQKQVANWMARELVPRLAKAGSGEVWCNDCHTASGRGVAKILGNPRSDAWAIEWMTAHLADDFERVDGKRLQCRACHGAVLGAPGFRRRIILSDALGTLPSLRPTEKAAPGAPAAVEGSMP